jgi:hypothetical protein
MRSSNLSPLPDRCVATAVEHHHGYPFSRAFDELMEKKGRSLRIPWVVVVATVVAACVFVFAESPPPLATEIIPMSTMTTRQPMPSFDLFFFAGGFGH